MTARLGAFGELVADRGHVEVRSDGDARLREPHPVDEARVVVRVADDDRVSRAEGRHEGEIGVVARGEHECGLMPQVRGEFAFECDVRGMRARHEAARTGARTVVLERGDGCGDDVRVSPQREVVVAGEVDADVVELVVDGRAGEAQLFAALCGVAQEDGVLIDLTAADGRIRWG